MKNTSIALVVAYFGKLPNYFDIWLYSCKMNPTIDWFLITDDRQSYNFPSNVHVTYTTFNNFANDIQNIFDFNISLKTPRKLCDFKVVYGELLENQLSNYAFWGYCDLDMIWGNIRNFITNDILSNYDKIGFVGSFTLFRNTKENNRRYRGKNRYGNILYKDYFSSDKNFCFDEVGINDIYISMGLNIYTKVIASSLASNQHNFLMRFMPKDEKYKNKNVIYFWDYGKLYHIYLYKNEVLKKEVLSLHFLSSRKFDLSFLNRPTEFLIVPNKIVPYHELTAKYVHEKSKPHWFMYILNNLNAKHSLLKKIKWLYFFVKYNIGVISHNDIYNYWVWCKKYNIHKNQRFDIFKQKNK